MLFTDWLDALRHSFSSSAASGLGGGGGSAGGAPVAPPAPGSGETLGGAAADARYNLHVSNASTDG
jgi:hypothetical protein